MARGLSGSPAQAVKSSPESLAKLSEIYARVARGGDREGGGIGLELISRLCEHLGWALDFSSDVEHGTTTLRLSRQGG